MKKFFTSQIILAKKVYTCIAFIVCKHTYYTYHTFKLKDPIASISFSLLAHSLTFPYAKQVLADIKLKLIS